MSRLEKAVMITSFIAGVSLIGVSYSNGYQNLMYVGLLSTALGAGMLGKKIMKENEEMNHRK